jgi:nucleotide-binding universal stress UspA family protein
MYRRILVPLDGSALAEAALPHAATLATHFQSSLTLLQVATPAAVASSTLAAPGADAALALEAIEASEQAAKEYLAAIAQQPELRGIAVQMEVVEGIPAREIVRRAKAGDVDMIVMSTHGRSGIERLVFGSVADQVLREAGLPILLIRPKAQTQNGSPETRSP